MRIYTSTRPIVDDDRRDFAHELDARAAVMIACGLLEAGKYYFNLREYHNDVKLAEIKRDALLAAYDADAPHDSPVDTRAAETQGMLSRLNSAEMVEKRGTVFTPYGWRKPDHHYKLIDGWWQYQA